MLNNTSNNTTYKWSSSVPSWAKGNNAHRKATDANNNIRRHYYGLTFVSTWSEMDLQFSLRPYKSSLRHLREYEPEDWRLNNGAHLLPLPLKTSPVLVVGV